MTKLEAYLLISQLRLVFDVVRLVDPITMTVYDLDNMGNFTPQQHRCFDVWGKSTRCANCISHKGCTSCSSNPLEKFETTKGEIFHVTSKTVEIEDRRFSLEIVSLVNEESKKAAGGTLTRLPNVTRERGVDAYIEILNEHRENGPGGKDLTEDYDVVCYVNAASGAAEVFTLSNPQGRLYKENKITDFYKAVELTLLPRIIEKDKEKVTNSFTRENIVERLEKAQAFYVNYQARQNASEVYYQAKFVRVENEGKDICFILGVRNIDLEARFSMLTREQEGIIFGLAQEYECVFHADFDTGEEHHYTIGKAFEEAIPNWDNLTSYEEHMKVFAETLVVESDREMFLRETSPARVWEVLSQKSSHYINYKIELDDKELYYQCKFIHHANHGNKRCAIVSFRNNDEEKRKEKQRKYELEKAKQEAEAANEAKSTFLFNMSHDIRTPMNAIIGYTDMAIKHINEPERVLDSLGKSKVASDHLLKLINDVLDMARIESGNTEIVTAPANIIECSNGLLSMLKDTAAEKDIDLTLEIKTLKNANVFADILHVNQVLINILSNSIKYTPNGGKVKYTIRQTDSTKADCTYDFIIEDNGMGMSQELVDNIFEAFVRAENSTISGIQGTGLGMAITKQLIDQMNGMIEIESELGKGTKTTVTLTFERFQSAAKEEAENAVNPLDNVSLSGKRILLVEDNEMNREIAKDILEDEGVVIEEAEDGTIAVDIIKKHFDDGNFDCYDAVLMDVQMPIMNGYDATRKIRELEGKNGHLTILAMTANAFDEDKQNALNAGMDAHLSKPIDIDKLIGTLKQFTK